ncbi:ABC transporter ATP-binding protein [Actinopolymorpha rutila]|nr:ABC transporter ATP-binding protein [Actinopolymorpha rutila]
MVPILTAQGLYRFYRSAEEEVVALRDVSLQVEAGELVAVTGPSGSGKSTLLSCVAGLDDPDGGRILVAGQQMSHVPERVRSRLRARLVGVMGQNGNLLDHLTVTGNVRLAHRLAGRHRHGEPARIREVVDSVGLDVRADASPSQLSGGEAARASLAVALVNRPPLLVADEPTSELDEEGERRIVRLLLDHAHGGAAVVVASHSPAVADSADRVVVITDGSITWGQLVTGRRQPPCLVKPVSRSRW